MAERIIPILTGADSRLTTTITYGVGYDLWYAFDGVTTTELLTTNNSGDITWIGTTEYILNGVQFTPRDITPERLPGSVVVYGSNDDGSTWTQIASITVESSSALFEITNSVSYTSYKFSFTKADGQYYMLFAEFMAFGDTVSNLVTVHCDTLRRTYTPAIVTTDTLRRTYLNQTVTADTLRTLHTEAVVDCDTLRRTYTTVSVPADTVRRRVIPFGYQQKPAPRNVVVTCDTARGLV